MTESAYSKVGTKLVERGYSAIPIMPGTKRPGELRKGEWIGKNNWREEYTRRLPSRFETQHWSQSDAGVCVVCGPASKDLIGVDIDTDDKAIRNAIVAAIPPTTLVKRGQKGETRFFRAPKIDKSKSWNLFTLEGKKYRVCDLIGPGRQTLLPPTIHPDTKEPYVWTGGEALEDTDAADLPELLPEHVEAISAALTPFGYEPEPEVPERGETFGTGGVFDYDKPMHRQLNDAAMANLDAWIPQLGLYKCRRRPQGYEAVAAWRASAQGRPLEQRKLNLKIARDGITDFGDGPRNYTPLNLVMAAMDLRDGEGLSLAFQWLSDALGWNEPPIILKERIIERSPPAAAPELPEKPVEAHGLTPAIATTAQIIPLPPPLNAVVSEPGPLPDKPSPLEALTRDKSLGVIGEIINWIEGTARRPNRVMALGVAVTVIGTLIGRRVAGPTRSATHLYVTCLAPTGSGKQHPLDCISLLLRSAQAGHLVGPSEFISMPAVINMLQRQPLCLSAQDEFGSFLKRINARNASSFERSVSKILRMVWSVSFSEYMTPEWAGRAASAVHSPALSIFGLSTPDEFYRGLQGSELDNGFLNRFLVLKTGRTDSKTPELEPGKVPDHIGAALEEVFRWGGSESSLGSATVTRSDLKPEPVILKWANIQASDCFSDLEKHVQNIVAKNEEMGWYMGRTAEIAIRLASIRAVGRWGPSEGGPTVDRSDIEWARDIAMQCGLELSKEAKRYMAENERQAWSNRILEMIKNAKEVSPRSIQQKIRGALKSAEIKDIIDGHVEAGFVEAVRGQANGRIVTSHYKYVGD